MDFLCCFGYDWNMQVEVTLEETAVLIRWKKRSDNHVLVRMKAEAILYASEGVSISIIAKMVERTERTVQEWLESLKGTGGDKHYVHKQETSSDTWEVTHNLGKEPAVTVTDSAGTEVIGEVEYVSLNKCILRFQAPFSGKAIFN